MRAAGRTTSVFTSRRFTHAASRHAALHDAALHDAVGTVRGEGVSVDPDLGPHGVVVGPDLACGRRQPGDTVAEPWERARLQRGLAVGLRDGNQVVLGPERRIGGEVARGGDERARYARPLQRRDRGVGVARGRPTPP